MFRSVSENDMVPFKRGSFSLSQLVGLGGGLISSPLVSLSPSVGANVVL